MQKRKLTPGNSKHREKTSVPSPIKNKKEPEVEATVVYRRKNITLQAKGLVKTDIQNLVMNMVMDLFDEGNNLVGTLTSRGEKDLLTLTFNIQKSSLTVKLIPDKNTPIFKPLDEPTIFKYPNLAKYRGKSDVLILTFEATYGKGDFNVKAWEINVRDNTPFSTVADNSKSIVVKTNFVVLAGKITEAVACSYTISNEV